MHGSLNPFDLLSAELAQQEESGYDATETYRHITSAGWLETLQETQAWSLLDGLRSTERKAGWAYYEPNDLESIKAASDWPDALPSFSNNYSDAIHRAWTGRIVGNMLGKPVEAGQEWTWDTIRSFLEANDAWPLRDYFPTVAETGDQYPDYRDNWTQTTRDLIDGSCRDDDVDYTILNLEVLREHGVSYTTRNVADAWLTLLPFLQTYTAERATIRNLITGADLGAAATYRNPYREWIGAAIRADIFGYVHPGDPARAAELAYPDARLSHVGNGVYGEMWCAALVASAFTAESIDDAISQSLRVVPRQSRLYEAISTVCHWHALGLTWEETRRRIEEQYGFYAWVHTINNAAVLTAGLLYGRGDFDQSVGLTVSGGWDTDSNGATAGSVAGILCKAIGRHWTAPLQNHVRTAVFGYDGISISELSDKTIEIMQNIPDACGRR